MSTRLLLAVRHLSPEILTRVVPPPFSDETPALLEWEERPDRLSFVLPVSLPENAVEILPCFSSLSPSSYSYRFTLEFTLPTERELRRAALTPIGDFPIPSEESLRPDPSLVESDIDLFVLKTPLATARLRIDLFSYDPSDLQEAPALLSVSVRRKADASTRSPAPPVGPGAALAVPVQSQRILDPRISGRVCSPVSLAMVLGFHDRPAEVYQVIERTRHEPTGLYGVWPANIHAASHWKMLGYLLHFPSWEPARILLDRGLPIIASIRYEKGELTHSPIPRSSGHLVVIRGYAGETVLVNDPAAPDLRSVSRAYALDEFLEVWLGRAAVGYVLFPGHHTFSGVSPKRATIPSK